MILTTSKLSGVFETSPDASSSMLLDITLLYQSYHNVHHLYPSICFWQMAAVWQKHKRELLEAGTPVAPMYDKNNGFY